MDRNGFSDYGSGSSVSSTGSSWNLDSWPSRSQLRPARPETTDATPAHTSADLLDLMVKHSTLADMMEDFKRNGYDSPYNPEEDEMPKQSGNLIGMGPSSVYLRQKSWPAPESTPAHRLPRPKSEWIPSASAAAFIPHKKVYDDIDLHTSMKQLNTISAEQVRVLNSLPNAVVYGLLRDLERERSELRASNKRLPEECRFCKNNGEGESYYKSHALKDANGRVLCPVLRKFVCKRCGARGDNAHTIKYCPLSTDEERVKSSAMMRSVRQASGRRRAPAEPLGHYVVFGDTPPAVLRDYYCAPPLDPLWADLEQKLTLLTSDSLEITPGIHYLK